MVEARAGGIGWEPDRADGQEGEVKPLGEPLSTATALSDGIGLLPAADHEANAGGMCSAPSTNGSEYDLSAGSAQLLVMVDSGRFQWH